ncbi:MAG TPA: hypothetical protein VFV94_13740 [Polyangiaceae bacterium]|nr:hypothetical protein [Polyangiaceae bacterium]
MLRARAWSVALLAAAATAPACGGVSRLERRRDAGATDAAEPDAGPSDGGDGELRGNVASVVAGGHHACVLWRDGRVSCWGRNDTGQLGDGTTLNRSTPTQVIELPTAVSVAAYDRFTCAVVKDGTVRCWGSTDQQRLGSVTADPDPPWLSQPVTVPGVTDAFGLSRGSTAGHVCALTTRWLYCWGPNEFSQLAQGSASSSAGPAAATGGCCPVAASGSIANGCIVNESGFVACAGTSPGNAQKTGVSVFTLVPNIDDVRAVAAGLNFACALRTNGTVACWGANSDGELGDGTDQEALEPVDVDGLERVTKLAAGAHHVCALLDSGTVSCWGRNLQGELGNGTTEQANRPVAVLEHPAPAPRALEGVVDIAAGNEETCAVVASSYVYCWGSNRYGQLGPYATEEQSPWPIKVIDTFR